MITEGTLRIGTSGVVVPGSRQTFPHEFSSRSRLHYYSSLFNTVEINSTFKKTPMLSTFRKWSNDVLPNFKFTIKLSKEITHAKGLTFNSKAIADFNNAANHIGEKKGCLLVQFPASITANYFDEVEQILIGLQESDIENRWQKAVEFRSVTWYNDQNYQLLDKYNASMVLHDMPKSANVLSQYESKFGYFRFHGPKGDYRGGYEQEFLAQVAEKIIALLSGGKDVYAYFNNTMGEAFANATSLKKIIETSL